MSEQPGQATLSPGEAAAVAEEAFVSGMPLIMAPTPDRHRWRLSLVFHWAQAPAVG